VSSTNLILDIIARDRASREFDKVAGAANRTGGVLDGLGKKVVGAMSVTAVVAFGVASVRAFADAEQSQIQLQEAFRKFPALADSSFDALHAFNQEMEDKVAIDGDSLDAADAVLARFGLMGSEIEAVTPLLADYVTISGKTAPEAAESLGKALLGNARALKDLGIVFTPTGDRARDLATIMGLLQEKVGGAAEAFAGSAAGKLQAFDIAVGNIQEEVGAGLVPALTAATDGIKALADQAGPAVGALTGTSEILGRLGEALDGISNPDTPGWWADVPLLRNVAAVWDMLAGSLDGAGISAYNLLMGPLSTGWAAFESGTQAAVEHDKALAALGFRYDEVSNTWTSTAQTGRQLAGVVDGIGAAVERGGDALGVWGGVASESNGLAHQLTKGYKDLATAVAGLGKAFEELTGRNRDLIDAKSDLFGLLDDMRAKFAALKSPLNDAHTGFRLTTEAGRTAADGFNDIAEAAEKAATAAANKGKWGQARDLIRDTRKELIDQAIQWGMDKDAAKAYVDQILKVPPKVSTMIQVNSNIATVKALFDSIRSKVVTVSTSLHGFAGFNAGWDRSLADGFTKSIDDVTKKVVDKTAEAEPVFNWAGGLLAAGLLDGLTDKTDDSDESISAFIDRMKEKLAKLVDKAKDALDKAKDELADYRKAYWATLEGIQGDMQGFGALTGFDLSGARQARAGMTQADAAVSEAQTAVSTAQGDVLLATTDEERAAAINAVTEAEQALTAALEAQAAARETLNASDTTAANIASSMRGRIAQIKEFAAALRTLKGMGLGADILSEILRAGPVDGLELAKALIEGGPSTVADINAAQAELNSVSRDIGRFGADLEFPDFKARVEEMAANVATLQAKYDELARLQKVVVELHIDGKKIVETLLRYRREHGGVGLGLDG